MSMGRTGIHVVLAAAAALAGCEGSGEPDAFGNFEADEVVVSAETGGQVIELGVREGDRLDAGTLVAVIDTTALALERAQAVAQREAVALRVAEADRQVAVLEAQLEVARRAHGRTRRLHAQQAATVQQLDQAEREVRVLERQIAAVRAGRSAIGAEAEAGDVRVRQVADRIAKAAVTNPVAGTVLAIHARAGETVQPGQPLYRIASLDTLDLRAYVSGTQLASVRIGAPAEVSLDAGEGRTTLTGTITWVSSEAEFTPTPIQTRDERADLVYAVKIRVPNPAGIAKIGMPADIRFREREE